MGNILEYQAGSSGGYRWDVEAWRGGDVNRVVLNTEGEGTGRDGVEDAEVQFLYSSAVARYTDLRIGVCQDIKPRGRTYATAGVEALLPYWFDVEAALFLSPNGDVLGRVEGYYDFQLTQRLVLQPRADLGLSAQNVRETGTGPGLTQAELGLRLRYEMRREFALMWASPMNGTLAGQRISRGPPARMLRAQNSLWVSGLGSDVIICHPKVRQLQSAPSNFQPGQNRG